MLYSVNLNDSNIISFDVISKAKIKALELKKKYPGEKITISYSTWSEGKNEKNSVSIINI